jgi:TatA/E family protein of Tat protein translocase
MNAMSPLAFMTGGPGDWMIIAIVALLLFGPKRLPEVGKQLGQAMREFNKIKDELVDAAQSVHEEVKSAYEPLAKPYSQDHSVSSPTVNLASSRRTYDQAPEDLMAPVVPVLKPEEMSHNEHAEKNLLTPPPALHEPESNVSPEKGN